MPLLKRGDRGRRGQGKNCKNRVVRGKAPAEEVSKHGYRIKEDKTICHWLSGVTRFREDIAD